MDLLQALPDTVRFMPHGHCFFWRPEILWLHVASDAVIALAYYSIPLTLLVFLRRRSHTRFAGVVLMFSAFIFACGTTHLFSIATMWNPLYRAEGLVKLVTAGVSLTTAVALWPILPRMLDLPDPAELAEANDALRREVAVREAAEEKLRQSNEELQHRLVELDSAQRELRGLLEATPDAMLIVDAEGRIESANREVSRLFGYESDELSGRSVEDLVPERFHETHPEHRSRFLEDPRVRPMGSGRELFALRRDGTEFPVEVSLSPVGTERGMLVISAIRDITERKRYEERLLRLNEELEMRVRLRTSELEAQARELERSNAELEQYAYMISHDIKSPMRGISALAEWIAEDHGSVLGEEGRCQIQLLRERVKRVYDMIEGVLRYSRVGRRKSSGRVDANVVLEGVIDGLTVPDGILVEAEGSLPSVEYDEVALAQVLQNLIGNAIRHMGKPEGVVRVGARETPEAWELYVRDTGVGIAPEHHERIFQIFQKLSADADSTGIGLALVKKIVESNGGRIRVESRPGEGSCFSFTIPRAIARATPGGPSSSSVA